MLNRCFYPVFSGLIILLFGLGLFRYYSDTEPYPTGDGIEYLLSTEAWVNHGSPDIRVQDFRTFKKAFIAHQSWSSNYKAAAFDEVERFLADKKKLEFGGFYRTKHHKVYGYHFVFYSLINVPCRMLCSWFDLHPILGFVYTNIFLWMLFFAIIFLQKAITWQHQLFVFLGIFISGAFYYNTWTHPEMLTVILLSLGILCLNQEKYHGALLFMALATLQNQPLIFLLLWSVFYIWKAHRFALRPMFVFAGYGIIPFIPAIYFYSLFGTTNLIKDAGFLAVENISFNRVFGFYFDLNQGMILSLGLLLIFYLIMLIYRAAAIIKHRGFNAWDLMPLVVLCMTLLVCAMSNWNHGMAIVNRYVVWIQVPIIFHLWQLCTSANHKKHNIFWALGLSSQVYLLTIHLPYNRFDWSNLQHMPLAKWMLDKHPSWYNPDPQIFIARTSQQFDFSRHSSPVFYFNDSNKLTKIAVHIKNVDTLAYFGYPPNKSLNGITVRNGKDAWLYINDFSKQSAFSSKKVMGLIKAEEILRILKEMANNPQWMEQLKQKALQNGLSLDAQMRKDAEFVFNERHHLD